MVEDCSRCEQRRLEGSIRQWSWSDNQCRYRCWSESSLSLDIGLNATASVLDGFRRRPFSRNQWVMSSVQLINWDKLSRHWGWMEMYVWMSLAYWWILTWWAMAMLLTGATYSENSSGPSTEPCRTPDSQSAVSDLLPPAATYWEWPDTNDLSQSNAKPFKPNVCRSRWHRIEWFTASKAADISSASRVVHLPWSAEVRMSFTIFSRAFSVE